MPGYAAPDRSPRQSPLGPVRPACAPFDLGTLVRPRGDLLGRLSDTVDYTAPILFGVAAHLAACGLTALLRWSRSDDCHREDDPIG